MGSAEQWACEELERLGLCEAQVIIRYLQPIQDPAEVRDYLTSLLDAAQPPHAAFIQEFLQRQQQDKNGKDLRFYRKPDLEDDSARPSDKKKHKTPKEANGRGQKDGGGSSGGGGGGGGGGGVPSTPPPSSSSSSSSSASSSGKKKKFVSLYSEDGASREVVLLAGRHRCECQASRHRLVGNCQRCGRVVCQQEGSGPCQFCGNLVVTREERDLLNRGSKKAEALQRRLLSEKNAAVSEPPPPPPPAEEPGEGLAKAVDHKNRLLEYDRTSERRTRVLDDESDYFNVDSRWLAQADRDKLRRREEELRARRFSRGGQTVTLDLVGRRLVEDQSTAAVYDPDDPVVQEVLQGRPADIFSAPAREEAGPGVEMGRPVYQDTGLAAATTAAKPRKKFGGPLRVQDRELQEMRDEGVCLSLHQPWAGLLVAGIKVHEGRTWYSPHRGRLWITAAAKIPQEREVREVEEHYRTLLGRQDVPFPHHYPPSCLLGCVDLVDVLPQEEYRERHPAGESECPYVFVCRNPQEMVLKFPIKGQHKVFKLDPKVHLTAKKALRPPPAAAEE